MEEKEKIYKEAIKNCSISLSNQSKNSKLKLFEYAFIISVCFLKPTDKVLTDLLECKENLSIQEIVG